MKYTELQVTSNFSFLQGASHPDELVEQAALYNYSAIAITDRNTLAGIVRAHVAAKAKNVKFIPGCRLELLDGTSLLAYPTNKSAWSRLSELLTIGNLRAEKGECFLYKKDVYEHAKELKFIAVPPFGLNAVFEFEDSFKRDLKEYRDAFGNDLYIAASRKYNGDDNKYLFRLNEISSHLKIPLIATNDVHYHNSKRRQLQDVLTCIKEKCTIHDAGLRLYPNAERYLKPIDEMHRLFRNYPDAIKRTQEISEACQFSLPELKYEYPIELTSAGRTPQEQLIFLTWQGAKQCFGDHIPEKTIATIKHELAFIEQMNFANYFLTVHDIVRFARSKGILCQGRGSAANSTVCFCLGITSVNPTKFDLLFERFISAARNEPPDIDVDFEHERREEVIQYIYEKYGRDRSGIVATVTMQRQKGAIRDVAKAMGLSLDTINKLSDSVGSIGEYPEESFQSNRFAEQGFNIGDRYLHKVLELTQQYLGFPRQLGQHTGGFVITSGKLTDLCPILNARMENRTCIEWNKDDIDALGFLKIDVLALGMLTCIRKAFDLCKIHYGLDLTLANIPQDDPGVYEMICHADTIGVFQIESRAQQSMLPRLRPKTFYDLVIEVAIVRPGPIQGDMVHPYLRRRNGEEPVEYPSKELEEILGRTLGVPLFQEQAMKIAIVAAGFTPTEADELRRSMATFKAQGQVTRFQEKLTKGMIRNGYTKEYAQRVFKQLEGFGSYGFPESHAASFALLVYVSSWLKYYYPNVFACALLNSQPMGFYAPAQIVSDARKHGVEVRPVDINYSNWDNLLEEASPGVFDGTPSRGGQTSPVHLSVNAPSKGGCALRLGFRQVKGLLEEDITILIANRKQFYKSVDELRNTGLSSATLKVLANADAFRSFGFDRRKALWEVSVCDDRPIGIFKGQESISADETKISLPEMSMPEHVIHDYATISLSLKGHPVSFVRQKLQQLHIVSTNELSNLKDGDIVKVAGLVLVRQRPGTAKGVCFITIEDETGNANLVVFENLFEKYRKEILNSRLLMAEGKLQIEGEVIHVIVEQCYNLTKLLGQLFASQNDDPPVSTLSRADLKPAPLESEKIKKYRAPIQGEIFPKGRNFR
jgi:error-prone DNA polymerase